MCKSKPPVKIIFSIIVAGLMVFGCGTGSKPDGKAGAGQFEGTEFVESNGYTGCIRIFNDSVSVILEPNCGGRVIEYSLNGKNVIYMDPAHDGWIAEDGKKPIDPPGGRCDIGPEMIIPRRPILWLGKWEAEITGTRSARLISAEDPATGVQLIRDFVLSSSGSHLKFTQTIKNISDETKRYCHWSRTFVLGDGICLVPLSDWSKFPRGFMMYDAGGKLAYRMEDTETVRVRDSFFEITGPPPMPKFAIDSYAGWLGYITKNNLLMVKRYPVYMDRPYGDIAAFTVAIWYHRDIVCELEPIGPMETILPGHTASFTEEWWLFDYSHPGESRQVDLEAFSSFVEKNAR